MIEDTELLRRYAESHSEEAFAELVRRRIGLVYSAALRHTRDAHRAKDVTQTVFTALAQKAGKLARRPVLVGWLYRSAQFAATDVMRAESRRQTREQEASQMQELTREATGPDWAQLRPELDEVLNAMEERDRDAVLLRFFDDQPFAKIGATLHLTENAARMRVERALEKLRVSLARRGVTSTTAALGIALANQAGMAAPAGLAAALTGAVLASGEVAATATGAWTTFMGMTKLQVLVAGAVAAVGTTGFVWQARANARLSDEMASLRRQNQAAVALELENTRLARIVNETESARAQAAELDRLRGESTALRSRLQVASAVRVAQSDAHGKQEAPFPGPFFEQNQVDKKPKAIYQERPIYPAELRKQGINGRATVDFIVDTKGRVHNATVVSATHPAIGESAVGAMRKWEFEPAEKNGQPVAVHSQIPIVFTLAKSEDRPPKPADTSGGAKPLPAAFVPWF